MGNYNAKHHAYGIIALVIALVISCFISSCTTEKTVIKFHDKCVRKNQDSVLAKLFLKWYPVQEKTTIKTIYRAGKPIIKKGKDITIYANCDSAYRAAVAAAKKSGKDIRYIKVPNVGIIVSTADTIISKDTINSYTKVVKESTARLSLIRDQKNTVEANLQKQKEQTSQIYTAYHKWKTRALYEGGAWALLILTFIFRFFIKK